MLSSHSSESEFLNVVKTHAEYIDNDCDTIDNDDDESIDNNLHKYQQTTSTKKNAAINLVKTSSSTMAISSSDGNNLTARRPRALNLKPIITNATNVEETSLNLNFDDETSEIDGRTRNDTHKRITIAFNNIKYTCRQRYFWTRGKFFFLLFVRFFAS